MKIIYILLLQFIFVATNVYATDCPTPREGHQRTVNAKIYQTGASTSYQVSFEGRRLLETRVITGFGSYCFQDQINSIMKTWDSVKGLSDLLKLDFLKDLAGETLTKAFQTATNDLCKKLSEDIWKDNYKKLGIYGVNEFGKVVTIPGSFDGDFFSTSGAAFSGISSIGSSGSGNFTNIVSNNTGAIINSIFKSTTYQYALRVKI